MSFSEFAGTLLWSRVRAQKEKRNQSVFIVILRPATDPL